MYTYSNGLFAWRAFRVLFQYISACDGNSHRGCGLNYSEIQKNYKPQINLLSDIFSNMQYLYSKNQI